MLPIILTLVITNPYDGIDYGKINVYDFEETYLTDCIDVIEPEPDLEPEPQDEVEFNLDDYLRDSRTF